MTLSQWEAAGNYFSFSQHQIFYRTEGQGPTLLLIHGFPTASWDWSKMWNLLTPHFHVITLDLLGFGFSDKPPKGPYSIAIQADIVETFLKKISENNVHVMAHDYGDTVAQELLARRLTSDLSFSIRSMTLLNGGLFPETHRALWVQKALMSPIGAWISRFFTQEKLTANFNRIFGPDTQPSKEEMDAFWKLLNHKEGKKVFHLLIRYMRERQHNRARWVESLQKNAPPLLLVNGEMDPISGKHMVARFTELVSNAQIARLPHIGHYPQLEDPKAVFLHYHAFFSSLLQE